MTVTPWATTHPTHWAAMTFHPSSGLCTSTKMLSVASTLPPISRALASFMRSSPWKYHSILIPWQTPQMVLAQNNASEGAMWWVNRREKIAPAIHTMASKVLAPRTPEISSESRFGSWRCREVSRDAEMSKPYSTTLAIRSPIAWAKTTTPQPEGPSTCAR